MNSMLRASAITADRNQRHAAAARVRAARPASPGGRRAPSCSPAVAAVAAGLLLAFAPSADADSITYVKGNGELWIQQSDGAQAHLVSTGDYESTSQADDGTILAAARKRIVRISRRGHVLSSWGTETENMPTSPVLGPYDARISPDGTKVTYWVNVSSTFTDPNGRYWSAGRFNIWRDARSGDSLGITNFYSAASWIDSSRALLFDDGATGSPQVVIAGVGQNHNDVAGWFRDEWSNGGIGAYRRNGEGELSRDGERLATVRSANYVGGGVLHEPGNAIAIFDAGDFDSPPTMHCEIHATDGSVVSSPQWSPSGDAVLWEQRSGTWISPVNRDCTNIAPRLLIPGGYRADWGALDPGQVDAPAPTTSPTPVPGPTPTPTQGAKPGPTKPDKLALEIAKAFSAKALRGGLTFRVHLPAAGRAQVTVRDGRTRVARAVKTLAAGDSTVVIAVPARYRTRLGRPSHRVLTVAVNVAEATVSRTAAVTR